MITPRTTRLVRAADLRSFRRTLIALATEADPLDARDRLVIVPTRAAAMHLIRSIEDRVGMDTGIGRAVVLPDFVTRAELAQRLFDRVDPAAQQATTYTTAERETLLTLSCRAAIAAGAAPPFQVRPGLVSAMLEFFDTLRRQQKSVDDFERLTIGRLDAGAGTDRGAERLIRQTRFFAAAFRAFEHRCVEAGGVDEHAMLTHVLTQTSAQPWRHVIVAVRDRAGDRYGLYPADWDVLSRIPSLERLDVVVTDHTLAGPFHERMHQLLPGIEELRVEALEPGSPPATCAFHVARDREEELGGFARSVRAMARSGEAPPLDRIAFVVRQRLPYVYVAREVFRSAGVPCQMFDALPLAAEPFAAALDVLFSFVSANFARVPAVALLRSPYFRIAGADATVIRAGEVSALDRALSESGYLGDADALDRLVSAWQADGSRVPKAAIRAGVILQSVVREVDVLRAEATVATHLGCVLAFLAAHESLPGPDDPLRARQLRARGAVLALLRSLRDAHRRFDDAATTFDEVAAMVRRGIEAQTFAPRTGDAGVHLVDADSAPFGEFDVVQLAGLVDGEWPDRPRRSIFYSPAILRDLGWPADADRLDGIRTSFADLVRLPSTQLLVSTFSLEHDAIVAPSTLIDEIDAAGIDRQPASFADAPRSFEDELLGVEPAYTDALTPAAQASAARRFDAATAAATTPGVTAGHMAAAYSVSALERYQDCPFKFFAADVLQLDELPDDEPSLSPRARGRFIHEVFQRFFDEWDRRGGGTITAERHDAAREVFAAVAEPLLDRLPGADAGLERARLFGSAIAVGIVDVVLGLESARPVDVTERWLEYRMEGEFALGGDDGRRVRLKGVADRIDLLANHQLRVIDYKTGYAPEKKRALQVAVYALCAQERLAEQGRGAWDVDEAAYVAFSGKKTLLQVIKGGKDNTVLADARSRLLDVVDSVERGEFPPRPHDPRICSWCAYASVCRKDYVE